MRRLRDVSSGVLSELPDQTNINHIIQRERSWKIPRNPKILDELHVIPDNFRKTKVGEPFFIYDSFEDEHYNLDCDRIILLYCQLDKV